MAMPESNEVPQPQVRSNIDSTPTASATDTTGHITHVEPAPGDVDAAPTPVATATDTTAAMKEPSIGDVNMPPTATATETSDSIDHQTITPTPEEHGLKKYVVKIVHSFLRVPRKSNSQPEPEAKPSA